MCNVSWYLRLLNVFSEVFAVNKTHRILDKRLLHIIDMPFGRPTPLQLNITYVAMLLLQASCYPHDVYPAAQVLLVRCVIQVLSTDSITALFAMLQNVTECYRMLQAK